VSARDEVLDRLQAAIGTSTEPPIARQYATTGTAAPGDPALLDLLDERISDYAATVHRSTAADLPATVSRVLRDGQASRVGLAAGLPPGWQPTAGGALTLAVDSAALGVAELDALDGVVTGCAVAIAVTGTLVLDGSPLCGRRALTLVPDLHLCIVRLDQIVETVPEAIARLDPTRPLTFISGPSATSDIELERVEGVHGPRTLHVILITDG
jgi:L-lactate dehydrogenase complex protein LldG